MQYEQRQLQPTLICSQPWKGRVRRTRQVSGEALELEVALCGQRVAVQEVGETVHLPGAKGNIDEREALEDLLACSDCAQQPPTPTIRCGFSRLSRFASPRWAIRRLSAVSRIEHVLNRIRSACAREGASP